MSTLKREIVAIAAVALFAPLASARDVATDVGLTALIQRLGAGNQPTGAGIVVAQVEADEFPLIAGLQSRPDPAAFPTKTFLYPGGALDNSGHANVVGQNYYGSSGVAPGITTILSYNFAPWVQQSYLHAADGSNMLPIAPPSNVRVINNSWVAAFGPGNEGFDSEAMRRADLVIDRDDITIVNGTFNGAAVWPLMAFGYNSITVGAVNGGHWTGPTPSPWDGPGRQKPEMIGPDVLTSFAAPVIAGGAALMYQVAQTGPGLSSNLNARKSEVIKAVLMAGGNHGFNGAHAWSNNPATTGPTRGVTATPLDPLWGADMLNVDASHRILTGLEQNGSRTVPVAPNATAAGWDFAALNAAGALNYRFRLHQQVATVSILATWHRVMDTSIPPVPRPLGDYDLALKRINASGQAIDITGDAGLPYFASGNVVSQSSVDNVEHLFVRNLAAGDYVIELRRKADGVAEPRDVALAWIMPATFKPADINRDGAVNTDDLILLIGAWGTCPNPNSCPADINQNGVVNTDDLILLIGAWGT